LAEWWSLIGLGVRQEGITFPSPSLKKNALASPMSENLLARVVRGDAPHRFGRLQAKDEETGERTTFFKS